VRDDDDAEWRISYTLRAAATDAERAAVVAAVSAAWIAEAERILGLGAGDGGDDRLLSSHRTSAAAWRAARARRYMPCYRATVRRGAMKKDPYFTGPTNNFYPIIDEEG
jgi:hypothetical protein